MTRFVMTPDVVIRLVEDGRPLAPDTRLVAPTLLRSQILSRLYRRVRAGALEAEQARNLLDAVRRLKLRLLGDRVLQAKAWGVAQELGWEDTFDAEYVALTRLQADALVTDDVKLAEAVAHLVEVAPFERVVEP